MNFNEDDLQKAVKDGIITPQIFSKLIEYLIFIKADTTDSQSIEQKSTMNVTTAQPKFTIENFLYYFGGFIIISTMGWYLGIMWGAFHHGGLFIHSLIYFALFVWVGNILWKKDKRTPGGLLYVCAVSVVPLAVWAFEGLIGVMPKDISKYNDFHIWIRSGWIFMELATIAVGFIFLKFRKFPLLTLPICYSMWYLSMDIVPFLIGQSTSPTWGMRNFATFIFAFIMLAFAMKWDYKRGTNEDYSHWLYIFGAIMLWGVIISIIAQFKWTNDFVYFLTSIFNLGYMLIGIILRRRVFIIFGAMGFWAYLGYIIHKIIAANVFFTLLSPIILVIFGLLIIFSGIFYSKNCKKIENSIRNFFGIS